MPATAHATPEQRAARGKQARRAVPRASHAGWIAPADRPDPIALLEAQATTRVPELVPIRYGRMSASPFAFFRGAAAVMASDLAGGPVSGIRVQLCGDAHVSNFGGFASPERDLVFDLNDFDETLPGPWEWDLKRLTASAVVAARERACTRRQQRVVARTAVGAYREAMRAFATQSTMAAWYARIGEAELVERMRALGGDEGVARLARRREKARRKDSTRAFAKLTHRVDGAPQIASDPPLIVPLREMVGADAAEALEEQLRGVFAAYRATLPADRRRLLDRFRMVDIAHKVVGVGSVGTRAWIILLLGRDDEDPLFLQCKEAPPSVLAPFAGASRFANQGRRVVEGQRLMQATSDILLGWVRVAGLDGKQRDFYVRQLWDWKTSVDLATLEPDALTAYADLCGWTLARAHARSGDAIAIASYLGSGDAADRAFAAFAEAYADVSERDHQALLDAIDGGRLTAETGV